MSDLQKYLISPYDEGEKAPAVGYVGLASGSNIDGTQLVSTPSGSFGISLARDQNDTTYFEITGSAANTPCGYEIDLREPIQLPLDGTLNASFEATEFRVIEYDPGSDYTFSSLSNIIDGDGTTYAQPAGLAAGEVFGLEVRVDGDGEGKSLNNFAIWTQNAAASYTYSVYVSYDGTNYVLDGSFTPPSSPQGPFTYYFKYGISDFATTQYGQYIGQGHHEGKKKIKRFRFQATVVSSKLNPQFRQIYVNSIKYLKPDGQYLDRITLTQLFRNDTSSEGGGYIQNEAGTLDFQTSTDGVNFISSDQNSRSSAYINPKYRKVSYYNNRPNKKIKLARFINTNPDNNIRIVETDLYTWHEAPKLSDFEFNDSVLSTKAWNSSRYDGRQLSAKKLNKATVDDIGNNDRSPIIRNYTRNIYIGNEIVGMTETSPEDPSLVQFPDFSYAQINSYITTNEDGTITKNRLSPEENNDTQKKSFYRPFMYDLAQGSFCNFILGDPTVKNNLKSKYAVYFNGGQLKKLITLQTSLRDVTQAITDSQYNGGVLIREAIDVQDSNAHRILRGNVAPPTPIGPGGAFYMGGHPDLFVDNAFYDEDDNNDPSQFITSSGFTSSLHNPELYTQFYTGSLRKGTYQISAGTDNRLIGEALDLNELVNFSNSLISYKSNSNYKGDKRFFITAAPYHSPNYFTEDLIGNPKPLYTFEPGSLHTSSLANQNAGINTLDLSSLTTFEVSNFNLSSYSFAPKISILEYQFNPNLSQVRIDSNSSQDPDDIGHLRGKDYVSGMDTGSFIFSITEDDVPSVLIPLKKERDLPNGKGNKPFAVIPDNLHPYVKDNLIFYLSKAGIDIGGNATNSVEEDISKKPSQPSLDYLRQLALKRQNRPINPRFEEERRRFELSQTREGRRQLRQEDRNDRRNERRESREEKRQERRENRNKRRENRQGRKENRRNRRRRR